MAWRVVGAIVAKCLRLAAATAAGGQLGPADSAVDYCMGLWPSFPHGGTGAVSDGMPLSPSAETMLEGLGGVFGDLYLGRYSSRYVGVNMNFLNLIKGLSFQLT